MSAKRKRIYFVVNEGSVVFASYDEDAVEDRADELRHDTVQEEVEESGRDIDDLTTEELMEFSISAGANGGYYYTASVKAPKDSELDSSFETDEGDEITYSELLDCLSDEDDAFGEDMYDGD